MIGQEEEEEEQTTRRTISYKWRHIKLFVGSYFFRGPSAVSRARIKMWNNVHPLESKVQGSKRSLQPNFDDYQVG